MPGAKGCNTFTWQYMDLGVACPCSMNDLIVEGLKLYEALSCKVHYFRTHFGPFGIKIVLEGYSESLENHSLPLVPSRPKSLCLFYFCHKLILEYFRWVPSVNWNFGFNISCTTNCRILSECLRCLQVIMLKC